MILPRLQGNRETGIGFISRHISSSGKTGILSPMLKFLVSFSTRCN
jgi:hypothetical protein